MDICGGLKLLTIALQCIPDEVGEDILLQLFQKRILFLLHPVTETKFFMEDYDKYLYFKFVKDKPVFDRIE